MLSVITNGSTVAILVAFSAILETLQLHHKESFPSGVKANGIPAALKPVVPNSVRFFDKAAWTGSTFGTIVWGYDDLMVAHLNYRSLVGCSGYACFAVTQKTPLIYVLVDSLSGVSAPSIKSQDRL